jgi:3-phenylpropionate/trans-cinnamate dioxygenase ferredoxin subunit
MDNALTRQDKLERAAADAWPFFQHMTEFVGFSAEDAQAIREAGLVIEKHLPSIVADFYTHLLRYAPTRKHFQKKDGTLDLDYVQKRMQHLTHFWRRTATGMYDEEYAKYVDYVGRAHTRQGADPNIYIEERYVIGQVGFIQRAITDALYQELHEYNHDLEQRASRAWNLLMMVILEMLSRAYASGAETTATYPSGFALDPHSIHEMAVEAYEYGLGLTRPTVIQEVYVAAALEIPEGARKIVKVGDLSVGVFHHHSGWYAVRNHCMHRGGPVAAGLLEGDNLVCPWHGYRYDLATGKLLVDPSVKLDTYSITIRDGEIYLLVPEVGQMDAFMPDEAPAPVVSRRVLRENEIYEDQLPPGQIRVVRLDGQAVAVYNVGGSYYATQAECTHAGGPLAEGELEGSMVVCPIHGGCFDITNGRVLCDPPDEPLKTYPVRLEAGVLVVG